MILDDTSGELARNRGSSSGAMARVRVDVGAAFPFSQEVGSAPEIPDAFIDHQHHHPRHHANHILSEGHHHELLHDHGYNVDHNGVSHGYVPHLYDVTGALLSEADLEGHVFHQLGEDGIVLHSTSDVKEGDMMDAERHKYYDQNGREEEIQKQHNQYEFAGANGSSVSAQEKESREQPHVVKERGGYTWWWRPGLIEPILDAVRTQQSYFKAVNYLKESEYNRDGRYDKLAPSTIESWFVRGSYVTLKNQYLHHRQSLERATRPGQKSILSKYPALLSAIKSMVRAEIQHSVTINSYTFDMKFVQQEMKQLIYQHGRQEILKEHGGKLTLSPKFVRRFVKKHFADMPDPFPKRARSATPKGHGCSNVPKQGDGPSLVPNLVEVPPELGQLLSHK